MKRGAPKGGRVHWLLWQLPIEFRRKYLVSYDYAKHNYLFIRKEGGFTRRKFFEKDMFIVVRTSRRCFRVCAHDCMSGESEYASLDSGEEAAEYIAAKSAEYERRREEKSNNADGQET